jgi:predicted nuclease of predicted toxin-antitoxin system
MRLLADVNFPGPLVERLRALGHDFIWARSDCPGWKDKALIELAESQQRIVLTLDKDFWQISFQRKPRLRAAGVVLFQVHPATVARLQPLLDGFLRIPSSWGGLLVNVSLKGIETVSLKNE